MTGNRWGALFGVVVLGVIGALVLLAPLIATKDPYTIHLKERLQPPGKKHLLGTDSLGRDTFSRLLYGGRATFLGVFLTAAIAAPLGLFLGMVAGFFGGYVDIVFCRVIDLFFSIPRLILALVFVAVLGPGLINAVLAVALTMWPSYARMARVETITLCKAEYIEAAKLQGAKSFRLICHYIFPMTLSSLTVRLSLDLGAIIASIASIGFLGLGAAPPVAEWGAMAAEGRSYILTHWWLTVVPGAATFLVGLSFNLIGESLRDVLDPQEDAACL